VTTTPRGLATGGRALWKAVVDLHDLDALQEVQLLEACRAKDRLDRLDQLLRGEITQWAVILEGVDGHELRIDSALSQANTTANQMKQLLAALRLPDEKSGKRPQQRGGARGSYKPTATVTALDKLRQAAGG
jgi:hypothetical protein